MIVKICNGNSKMILIERSGSTLPSTQVFITYLTFTTELARAKLEPS